MVDFSREWTQLSFLPPVDIVIALTVTIHVAEGFCTVSCTAVSEPTDEVISMLAAPYVAFADIEDRVREFGGEFTKVLRENTGPF